jgi:hypothetical protein
MSYLTYVCGLDTGRCAARHGRFSLVVTTRHILNRCSDVWLMLFGEFDGRSIRRMARAVVYISQAIAEL